MRLFSKIPSRNRLLLVLVIGATLISAFLYTPALFAYFTSDDFSTVAFLFFNRQNLDQIPWFLFQSNDGGLYFRPLGQLFYLIDYWMWGIEPFGYHLTNFILHAVNCVLVYALAALIGTSRRVGVVGAVLFAVMAVHSEAVAWIGARYDVICAYFFLATVVFFGWYRKRAAPRFYWASLGTFFLALASKEIAVTLVLVLLAYDLVMLPPNRRELPGLLRRHLPFWLGVGLVIAARVLVFGRIGYGNSLNWDAFTYWVDKTLERVLNPLTLDGLENLRWLLLAALVLIVWLYRSRRAVIYGAVWIPLVYLATFNSGASERSFYIPSFGLALALSTIFAAPLPHWQVLSRVSSLIAVVVLMVGYSLALYSENQQFQFAGEVAKAIPDQVKANHPQLPDGARLVFTGVPDELASGVLIYITGLTPSFQLNFRNPTLETLKVGKFPVFVDGLDKTFFFEVDHRRVRERADLVQMLQVRSRCTGSDHVLAEWNFTREPLGWEPWNDLAAFEDHDGVLTMRAEGKDPILASPSLNVPAIEIGEVAVVMRVRSDRASGRGSVYWLASGQDDFSPDLQKPFDVQADGEWRTYRAALGASGKLFIGDQIRQLRLDPFDAPAEIAIKSIAIGARCVSAP